MHVGHGVTLSPPNAEHRRQTGLQKRGPLPELGRGGRDRAVGGPVNSGNGEAPLPGSGAWSEGA